jgi:prepilin-type N-terminal cleavage/methylation domain-containing protein
MYIKLKHPKAFTIAELIIALAITGLLLAAVATAINASAINYAENEDMSQVTIAARQLLSRITTQLRTASAVDPAVNANECSLICDDGTQIIYRYNSDDDTVYLVTSDNSSYVLCKDITAMTFDKQTVLSDSVTYVKSVQITMTIQRGSTIKNLAAATVIRKNIER